MGAYGLEITRSTHNYETIRWTMNLDESSLLISHAPLVGTLPNRWQLLTVSTAAASSLRPYYFNIVVHSSTWAVTQIKSIICYLREHKVLCQWWHSTRNKDNIKLFDWHSYIKNEVENTGVQNVRIEFFIKKGPHCLFLQVLVG